MKTNSPKRLRETQKESTRQAIIDAAELVCSRNLDAVRLEDIAQEAGVAIGTLYNYFTDRQALLDVILDTRRKEANEMMRKVLHATSGRHIRERLSAFLNAIFEYANRHHAFLHNAFQLGEYQKMKAGKRPILDSIMLNMNELIADAISRNELNAKYRELYPAVILGMIRSVFSTHRHDEPLNIAPDTGNLLTDILLDGAKPEEQLD